MLRLARVLKINKAQAIGHLHLLWWWTLDFAPSGDLSAFASCELGSAAEWQGDGDHFINALKETGWIDPDGVLHDWEHYTGSIVAARAANRERQRRHRERWRGDAGHAGVTRDSRVTDALVMPLPNSTQPNRTQPDSAPIPPGVTEPKAPPGGFPGREAVRAWAKMDGGTEQQADAFWAHFEAVGWVNKHGQALKNPRVKFQAWIANERAKSPANPAGENARNGADHRKPVGELTDAEILRASL